MHACKALDRQKISLRISPEGVADDSGDRGMMYEDAWQRREVCGRLHTVPIPLVESALLPSAIDGSCDLSPIVNLVFLIYLPFIAPVWR